MILPTANWSSPCVYTLNNLAEYMYITYPLDSIAYGYTYNFHSKEQLHINNHPDTKIALFLYALFSNCFADWLGRD